jgi:hypothetical protein
VLAIGKMDFVLDNSNMPGLEIFFGDHTGLDSMTLHTTKGTCIRSWLKEVGY